MPRTYVAGVQPLFEDKEPLAFVAHGVLFGRNDLMGRLHWWMVRLDGHLEESASRRRLVRFAWLEDRDVSSGHLSACAAEPKLDLAKRHDHAIPTARRSGRSAWRRVLRHTHVLVLERYRVRLKKPNDQKKSHGTPHHFPFVICHCHSPHDSGNDK